MKHLLSKLFYSTSIFRNPLGSIKFFKNLIRFRKAKNKSTIEGVLYKLLLNGQKVDLNLRTYTGDIDIFYEVFWAQCYQVPASLKVKQYSTIVDLGANIGLASIYFKSKYPEANVYAVEMETDNYVQLKKNVQQFKNTYPIFGAIYDETTNIKISNTELAYNFKIEVDIEKEIDAITVATLTMPDLIADHQIKEIDLLKIDIEGAEQRLLGNNNEWLSKVNSILIELHEPYTIKDLEKDLAPFNFQIYTPEQNHELKMIYAVKTKL
ncbi:FkbM family methyltransferase [Pedobacter xixiisoli]|nr:FkbM family methyltransferase [Pedobacter xixiisoli]